MLTHINTLMATGGPSFPHPSITGITVISRDALRQRLIEHGWFDDGQLIEKSLLSGHHSEAERVFGVSPTSGGKTNRNDNQIPPELRRTAYTAENNALRALKRRSKIGYTRDYAWLQ
jgi:hypothetical protein